MRDGKVGRLMLLFFQDGQAAKGGDETFSDERGGSILAWWRLVAEIGP